MANKAWTVEEDLVLKTHGALMLSRDIQEFLPHRTFRSIQWRCSKLGIKKTPETLAQRNDKIRNLDLDEFKENYNNFKLNELVRYYKLDRCTIERYARICGLPLKCRLYKNIDEVFTQMQKEIIEGTLLGDSTLSKINNTKNNSRYSVKHCLKQKEYLYWLFNNLKPFSTNLKENLHCSPLNFEGKIIGRDQNKLLIDVSFQTVSHPYLTELEKKWYLRDVNGNYILKNGIRIKVVPKDLVLTPLSLALWYWDDGTNNSTFDIKRNIYRYQCILYTLSFTQDECEFLASQIRGLGIKNCYVRLYSKNKNQFETVIGQGSYMDFINLIKPYLPHESLGYKINTKGYEYNSKRISKMPQFRPYEDACLFTRKLGLKSCKDWKIFCISGGKPKDIPSVPERIYKEWKGYDYWLGNDWFEFTLARNQARELAKEHNITSSKKWSESCKLGLIPHNIPYAPDACYDYVNSWISWGDWLGTFVVAPQLRRYKSFNESREYVRFKKIKTKKAYIEWAKSSEKPNDIPACPRNAYKDEFKGYKDYLGY